MRSLRRKSQSSRPTICGCCRYTSYPAVFLTAPQKIKKAEKEEEAIEYVRVEGKKLRSSNLSTSGGAGGGAEEDGSEPSTRASSRTSSIVMSSGVGEDPVGAAAQSSHKKGVEDRVKVRIKNAIKNEKKAVTPNTLFVQWPRKGLCPEALRTVGYPSTYGLRMAGSVNIKCLLCEGVIDLGKEYPARCSVGPCHAACL